MAMLCRTVHAFWRLCSNVRVVILGGKEAIVLESWFWSLKRVVK